MKAIHVPKPVTNKDAIIAEAERIFETAFVGTLDEKAACLYWTACVVVAARSFGVNLSVQAGSASFKRLPDEMDDGKPTTHTHFSYVWEGATSAEVRRYLSDGVLPEMHVWAADVERGEIVDLTTRHLKAQCEQCTGDKWFAPDPPKTLWAPLRKLPTGWCFVPNLSATQLAVSLMCAPDVLPVLVKLVRQ